MQMEMSECLEKGKTQDPRDSGGAQGSTQNHRGGVWPEPQLAETRSWEGAVGQGPNPGARPRAEESAPHPELRDHMGV